MLLWLLFKSGVYSRVASFRGNMVVSIKHEMATEEIISCIEGL